MMSRLTREMFCLMEGRHVHPSTLYPGGVGTVATVQLFTDYHVAPHALHRLPEARGAAARRPVRLLLRGAARLSRGRPAPHPARLLGQLPGSRGLQLQVRRHDRVGARDVRHARRRRRRQAGDERPGARSTSASASCSAARIYDDWQNGEKFVTHDPLGNPVDARHPWNQTTTPHAAEARLRRQVQLGHVAALVRRQGPPGARHRRRTDRAPVVDGAVGPGRHRLRQGDRQRAS